MFTFQARTRHNFASYSDPASGRLLFIDSLDNRTFQVRLGTLEQNELIGELVAETDQELNQQLRDLLAGLG